MAESVKRIISPSASLDRAGAIDRERDRNREREKEARKRGIAPAVANEEKEAPPALPEEEKESTDPKKGKALDIKV
ncbi:MAG TPA: hypothetical protein VGL11_24615 [Candidatus Binatia bacterium]